MGGPDIEEKDVEKASSSLTPSESIEDSHDMHDAPHQDTTAPPSTTSRPSYHRAPSTRSIINEPVPVPSKERRGWLARVSIVAEVQDPKDYARRTKWFITFIVAVAAAAAPMGSGIVLRTISKPGVYILLTVLLTP